MDWWTWVVPLVGMVAVFLSLIMYSAWRAVRGQSDGPIGMALLEPHAAAEAMGGAAEVHSWAEQRGFEWIGLYRVEIPNNPSVVMAIWGRPEQGRVASNQYFVQYRFVLPNQTKTSIECVDLYADMRSLSTTSASGGLVFPGRKGLFRQAFPGLDTKQLYDRHQAAQELLVRAVGVRPRNDGRPLEDIFVESIVRSATLVRQIPLWPLVVCVRFFTNWARANRSIAQQWGGRLGPMS